MTIQRSHLAQGVFTLDAIAFSWSSLKIVIDHACRSPFNPVDRMSFPFRRFSYFVPCLLLDVYKKTTPRSKTEHRQMVLKKMNCDYCGKKIGDSYIIDGDMVLCPICFLKIYKTAIEDRIGVVVLISSNNHLD